MNTSGKLAKYHGNSTGDAELGALVTGFNVACCTKAEATECWQVFIFVDLAPK